MHPQKFKELNEFNYHRRDWQPRGHAENPHERIILIPIRKTCKNETDVSDLIDRVVRNIRERKALSDFSVAQTMNAGESHVITDALILQPNFAGVGVDLKLLAQFLQSGLKNLQDVLRRKQHRPAEVDLPAMRGRHAG